MAHSGRARRRGPSAPVRELLEWVAFRPVDPRRRDGGWWSTCPRYTPWEDALDAGLLELSTGGTRAGTGCVSRRGDAPGSPEPEPHPDGVARCGAAPAAEGHPQVRPVAPGPRRGLTPRPAAGAVSPASTRRASLPPPRRGLPALWHADRKPSNGAAGAPADQGRRPRGARATAKPLRGACGPARATGTAGSPARPSSPSGAGARRWRRGSAPDAGAARSRAPRRRRGAAPPGRPPP